MVWLWLLVPLALIAGTTALAAATHHLDGERRRLQATTAELTALRIDRGGAHGRSGAHR